jgi:hypothetical protein
MDAKQAKVMAHVSAALPALTAASAALDKARGGLTDKRWTEAQAAERDALIAIAQAIEEFSDLKQTIELAYAEQQQLVSLLGPEAAKALPAAERGQETRDGLRRNLTRVTRLKGLLADEVAGLDAKAQQVEAEAAKAAAGGGGGSGSAAPDPKQLEAAKAQAKQQLEQARAQLTKAEELRGQAETSLNALEAAITANKEPLPPAKDAEGQLAELRRLFFSVIEHLQELLRDQNETRDQTGAAAAEDDFTRGPKLPGLLERQDRHATMAQAITEALAHQADAASKAPQAAQGQGPTGGGAEQAKALGAAADEVRLAKGEMVEAKAVVQKAKESTSQSVGMGPAVEHQGKAIEHLENALKLLQPPPKKQDQKDQKQDQKQDQQDQKDQKKDPKDQQQGQQGAKPDPKQQQGGAGQRARDDDARRQRERQEKNQPRQPDSIDKDW